MEYLAIVLTVLFIVFTLKYLLLMFRKKNYNGKDVALTSSLFALILIEISVVALILDKLI